MQVNKIVLNAIKDLGYKVSSADLATKTGLSLSQSRLELNKIANDTKAILEVSSTGEVVYKFYRDLESIYKVKSIYKAISQIYKQLFDITFFLIRISFGILLIASFLTIVIVFIVALIFILFGIGATDSSDAELSGDLGSGSDLSFDFFDLPDLGMFFSWSTIFRYETPNKSQVDYFGRTIDLSDRGFFQNCFSFLFGDGDPNKKLQDMQWQKLATLIRENDGVLTPEQIAPCLIDINSTDSIDSTVFPLLLRFDGYPEVTEKGNIVYLFPSMQISAREASTIQHSIQALLGVDTNSPLKESEWIFTHVSIEKLQWIFFFAGANLCGAYALYHHLSWFKPLEPFADQIHLLMLYAIFFMGFPIMRQLFNNFMNISIDMRNKLRESAYKMLASTESQTKVFEAKEFAIQFKNLTQEKIVYTSKQDLIEQEFEK